MGVARPQISRRIHTQLISAARATHQETMYKPSFELIKSLPKTDLHVHLDGSLRIETILQMADEQGVKLPAHTVEGLKPFVQVGDVCRSLTDYLRTFDITLSVLQTEESLYRAAFELVEDAAAENVRYMEVRYCPMLHVTKGLPMTTIVEAVLAGLRDGKQRFGTRSGLIISALRQADPQWSLRLAELAVAYKNKGVVGYDLAGAEDGFQARKHAAAFHLIRSNNVNCTARARRLARSRSTRRCTIAVRIASATARGCARTATCSTSSPITGFRWKFARSRTCRPARWRASARIPSSSTTSSAAA
jgi:adenosine deaminase